LDSEKEVFCKPYLNNCKGNLKKMKIALLGNSQLAVSTAWGLSQSEVAREVAFVSDAASNKNRFVHPKEGTPGNLRDLVEANALSTSDTAISSYDSLDGLANADVVVLLPPVGQSVFRSPQASKTTGIARVQRFVTGIQQYASDAKILVAISPTNYISAWIHQTLDGGQIIGLGNGAATAHLASEIAKRVDVSVKDVTALAIGSDQQTYPLPQYCRVNGIPLVQLMSETDIESLCESVTQRCPYTMSGEWTLVSHILQVVSAIALDKRRVMSVGTRISAGTTSVYLNVPAQLGYDGVASIVPLELTEQQREQFRKLVGQSAEDQAP
jgi:malate dehydrogenase